MGSNLVIYIGKIALHPSKSSMFYIWSLRNIIREHPLWNIENPPSNTIAILYENQTQKKVHFLAKISNGSPQHP